MSLTIKPAAATALTATPEQNRRIDKASKDFESQVLSSMLQSMFQGLKTDGPFGGGEGEEAFRSFMTDAFAKKITQAGGIGIAPAIRREMLKLQGLTA